MATTKGRLIIQKVCPGGVERDADSFNIDEIFALMVYISSPWMFSYFFAGILRLTRQLPRF